MVVGRGSFIDSFPLFGYRLEDYDSLFAEKLDLLLKIRDNEHVTCPASIELPCTISGVYPDRAEYLAHLAGFGGTPLRSPARVRRGFL